MDVKIAPDWKELLAPEFEKPYFADLTQFVRQEYATVRTPTTVPDRPTGSASR